MSVENHDGNPIIIEPAASPSPDTPPRLLTPSLYDASSSSNSFESSRPHSRASSATSPSESPSPSRISRSAYSHELSDISPPTPLNLEPPTPETTPPTAAVHSEPAENASYGNRVGWPFRDGSILSRRRWLEHALGIFGLVASLVGLLFIGVRTYKLAVISTENSTLDGCVGLIQAGFTTVENSTQLCKTAMKKGPLSSPYHLGKRALQLSGALSPSWMKSSRKQDCRFPYIACQSQEANTIYRNMSTPAIIITTTLALGGLIFSVARRNARATDIFTSPVRCDVQSISRENSLAETVTGQDVTQEFNPEAHDETGQLCEGIRASQDQDSLMKEIATFQSTNSSSTTLVRTRSDPQIPFRNRSSDDKSKGLVELQVNCKTKAFLKLESGEFFHPHHRKHHHCDDSGWSSDGDNPLKIEESDFGKVSLGASALAKGKKVKAKWIEELQLEHKKRREKHPHPTQQQVGDCISGSLTNELPNGKPQLT